MTGRLSKIINLVGNMGWRYTWFRAWHELMMRTGLFKKKFPAAPPFARFISLDLWKQQKTKFFFADRESLNFEKKQDQGTRDRFEQLSNGKYLLFNSTLAEIRKDDWMTNPDTGFKYDAKKHWTEITDYSKEAGDIKYVWERSRFSYLYDLIRYDYHFGVDCADVVFGDILSWIKNNPVNSGPNYRCSQEMSLRVMNWTFALYYYRNSSALTNEVFDQLQYAIYWHADHIYKNIDFSRIAVRNNHAVTETLALYFVGLFFPALPGAATWKEKGKSWFEQEIAYQVYEDGTFLQFSMNYHRIVVQLLTWAITLSEKNNERFSEIVYDRARKSVIFLRTCMVDEHGWLPNYGANDGALFFKLNDSEFRDYRGQLQALACAVDMDLGFESEDVYWYGIADRKCDKWEPKNGSHSFAKGGYYIIREPETLTFARCGNHKDRPMQADNLHTDAWYKGENVLTDAGSYKYNTDEETIRYFNGTASHNTVMLDDKDQMLKGARFIWYHWSQCMDAVLKEDDGSYIFTGSVNEFKYVKENIVHLRRIIKRKGQPVWEIRDEIVGVPPEMEIRQLWHVPMNIKHKPVITAVNSNGVQLAIQEQDGWASSLYGQKEKTREYYFSVKNDTLDTLIKIGADS